MVVIIDNWYITFTAIILSSGKTRWVLTNHNPTVSARLAQIPLFPITEAARKRASEVVRSQAQQNAVVQGQANRGEQVTDKIGDLNGETDGNQ